MNINEIKEQFKRVITYSQGIDEPKVDELFDRWFEAKKGFINMFKGECIYEVKKPITFSLDEKAKTDKVNSLIDYVWETNPDLARFIEYNQENFFDNKVIEPYPLRDDKVISPNTKLIKAFKYFETDKKLLHQIQDRASQILQENVVNGTLCFSVHPLDFLSSSLNNYNWRSCHALDGEYRAGNLSYMVDSCTVMCYLKGEDNVKIPLFPEDVKWNSKKWRMLVYLSPEWDMMFCGRPYPFITEAGMETATLYLKQVLNLMSIYGYKTLTNYVLEKINDERLSNYTQWLNGKYIYCRGDLKKLSSVVKDTENSLHFNDVLCSTCYRPYYQIASYALMEDEPMIHVGGAVKCLHCGHDYISDSSTMRCEECELKYGTETKYGYGYCECCGSRIRLSDSWYVENDGCENIYVCEHCHDLNCETCEDCGGTYFRSDMVYDRKRSAYICLNCKEDD